jgi:hypothetical protein
MQGRRPDSDHGQCNPVEEDGGAVGTHLALSDPPFQLTNYKCLVLLKACFYRWKVDGEGSRELLETRG